MKNQKSSQIQSGYELDKKRQAERLKMIQSELDESAKE